MKTTGVSPNAPGFVAQLDSVHFREWHHLSSGVIPRARILAQPQASDKSRPSCYTSLIQNREAQAMTRDPLVKVYQAQGILRG